MTPAPLSSHLRTALTEGRNLLDQFLGDGEQVERLATLGQLLADRFAAGRKVLICGNGGSACDAMHFAEELTGRFRDARRALPAIALTDVGHLSCVANDYGFEHVFERGVEAYGQADDLLIVLSTSGNSANVSLAVAQAQRQGMTTIAFLGKGGGQLRGQATHELIFPGQTADRIQELHMLALHSLIELVERVLFPENYPS
jgi:D-sedoheptulose 7-phosphate isomerase